MIEDLASGGGYLHENYARSFSEWAEARCLVRSRGWLLERNIPGTRWADLIGCYPLFCCHDWSGLGQDLESLGSSYVSLALVADTFGRHSPELLKGAFDIVRPFKNHFIVDPDKLKDKVLDRKHRRNLAYALGAVEVEICERPADHLEEWCALYGYLCLRHSITGMQAFSKAAHSIQLQVPGLVMLRARANGQTVGIHLWYEQGEFAYAHLGATSEAGYARMASYALYWRALQYFQDRVALIDIGSTPGTVGGTGAGLARFKRGWATGVRVAYFCARIFDPERYAHLAALTEGNGDFFPAYRKARSE